MTPRAYVLAIAAGVGLADASIVTLALPDILRDLNTSVEGVAAVIGVYTVVLAVHPDPVRAGRLDAVGARASAPAASRSSPWRAPRARGPTTSPVCSIARCAQAVGARGRAGDGLRPARWRRRPGAPPVAGCRRLRDRARAGAGGALTEAFDWRAIFVFQVPVAAAGAIAVLLGPSHAPARPEPERPERFALRPAPGARARLGCAGRGALPARPAARRGLERQPAERRGRRHRHPGWPRSAARASAVTRARAPRRAARWSAAACWRWPGCPSASLWWTVIPQALAGVGMGLALTALGGDLLPERTRATPRGCWPCATPASPPFSRSRRRSPPTSSTSPPRPPRSAASALVLDAPLRRRPRSSSRPPC